MIALSWPYVVTNKLAKQIAIDLGYKLLFMMGSKPVTPNTLLTDIPRYNVDSGSLKDFKKNSCKRL
ncbi:MAG: hypothetical protein PWP31_11 [Clostridia bacterium]|nr:hypothetical protein [Clostridia bacterium]